MIFSLFIYRRMRTVSITYESVPITEMTVKSSLGGSKMLFVRSQMPFSYQMSRIAQIFQILKLYYLKILM